jgi:hypothetical protein
MFARQGKLAVEIGDADFLKLAVEIGDADFLKLAVEIGDADFLTSRAAPAALRARAWTSRD